MQKDDGSKERSFKDVAEIGASHLNGLYNKQNSVNIVENRDSEDYLLPKLCRRGEKNFSGGKSVQRWHWGSTELGEKLFQKKEEMAVGMWMVKETCEGFSFSTQPISRFSIPPFYSRLLLLLGLCIVQRCYGQVFGPFWTYKLYILNTLWNCKVVWWGFKIQDNILAWLWVSFWGYMSKYTALLWV